MIQDKNVKDLNGKRNSNRVVALPEDILNPRKSRLKSIFPGATEVKPPHLADAIVS